MAIAKNTAKATEPKKTEKPAVKPATKPAVKPAAKPEVKKVAAKPADTTEAVETEKESAVTLGRKDLAAGIRAKVAATGAAISTKVAEICAVAYEEVITEALRDGAKVALTGFGTFSVAHRDAREATNPQKPGEKVNVAACEVPKFKPGAKLKAAVNGGAEVADAE